MYTVGSFLSIMLQFINLVIEATATKKAHVFLDKCDIFLHYQREFIFT